MIKRMIMIIIITITIITIILMITITMIRTNIIGVKGGVPMNGILFAPGSSARAWAGRGCPARPPAGPAGGRAGPDKFSVCVSLCHSVCPARCASGDQTAFRI